MGKLASDSIGGAVLKPEGLVGGIPYSAGGVVLKTEVLGGFPNSEEGDQDDGDHGVCPVFES